MKKKWMRTISVFMAMAIIFGSTLRVTASDPEKASDASAAENQAQDEDETLLNGGTVSLPEGEGSKEPDQNAAGNGETGGSETDQGQTPVQEPAKDPENEVKQPEEPSEKKEDPAASSDTEKKDVSGTVTTDEDEEVKGTVTVEEDKNDDKVEIKKSDKPYLALGQDLTAEQRATVLSLMGIDSGKLDEYDVVYVNNSEERQYLGSYIDKGKIGSRSLSSVVIVEREKGNGINISTNNITYCTVGMYKNALATAGISDADIIVAGPFPISGTAALVGVFKAYKEMTGDEIDEENIDAALNELVVTGKLVSSGTDSDEVEGMIAYVKQAVVEHDLSDESEIRKAIAEGCEKFSIKLTDEEVNEITKLMLKISELDLDLDGLLNAAQSIYDKISTADSGFWAKIRELFFAIWEKLKELFS